MSNLRITHIGGPTALVEVDGWARRQPRRRRPCAERGLAGVVRMRPRTLDEVVGQDGLGTDLLPSAGVDVTTMSGAKRLGGIARGLEPWATTRLEAPGRPSVEVTATPCRHGPPLTALSPAM